jgi:CheY-like chemotaxis protein
VRTWRNRRGISQEELAGRAGLHRTYVSDIERGARNVSLESIEKLARALDVSVASLFANGTDAAAQHENDGLVDILFVEDDPNDVHLTLRALKEAKITNRIHVVSDGAEALDYLFCTGRYADRRPERPQVILLDLKLPKVDGIKVLRRIKADARTRTIPVVVLTGSRANRDIVASKRLGAEAYIVKPVDFRNLSEVTPRLSLQWALLKPAVATT